MHSFVNNELVLVSMAQMEGMGWIKIGGESAIPAQPFVVTLYLRHLMNQAEANGNGFSVIKNAAYGIQWGHHMAALTFPINHLLLKSTMESAKRSFTRPISPKDTMPSQVIQEPDITLNQINLYIYIFILIFIF